MSIYDMVKDAISIAQKADNIDLIRKLLNVGQMALDLQNENMELKKQIDELVAEQKFEENIVRHKQPYFTLKSDGEKSGIYYCSTCYGKDKKKIQMSYNGESKLWCPACKVSVYMTPSKEVQIVYF